jgi:hypothetical protein
VMENVSAYTITTLIDTTMLIDTILFGTTIDSTMEGIGITDGDGTHTIDLTFNKEELE